MISLGVLTYHENSFIFQIVTTTPGETVTLPILAGGASYIHIFTAYWGDGTSSEITAYNDPDRIHTYAVAGTYDIELVGICQYLYYSSTTVAERAKVRKILSFTGDIGFRRLNFYGCVNLNSIVSFGTLASLITCSNLFSGCTSLTTIPTGLFDGCPLINDLSTAFENCNNIGFTTIPTDLFKYAPNVTTFNSTFSGCKYITSIPTGLFDYNINVDNFYQTFYNCNAITSIPTDLFKNNIKVTSFANTFYACTGILTIPSEIFKYNVLNLSFLQTFQSCTSLTTIPSNIFDTNIKVTSFTSTFENCTHITSIPTDLFKFNIKVTTFLQLFYGCIALTSIPTDLFKYNVDALTFTNVFGLCSALTAIPAGLFDYNVLATNFSFAFRNNTLLATIPTNLFRYNLLVTNFASTFVTCPKAQLNINIFYAAGEEGTRFLNKTVTFANCFNRATFTGIIGVAPDLWNCNFGTGTPTPTLCYGGAGNNILSLLNYLLIPVAWKT